MKEFLKEPFELRCSVKHYDWGTLGGDSLVADLSQAEIKPELPYSELWLGAHPAGSAVAVIGGQEIPLFELIDNFPKEILGQVAYERFGARLPFLFKVLSIAKPLSIQLHPDSSAAKQLHENFPEHYPDPFHKPELAIAISTCELLWGFRPYQQILRFISDYPELADLLNIQTNSPTNTSTAELYKNLFHATPSSIQSNSQKLYERISQREILSFEETWILKLSKVYPQGNVGIFSIFFLNLLKINPGEVIFTAPGVVHAYLSGELVECMASSDNVIRAGLTTKFCDIETLLKLADYSATTPNITFSTTLERIIPVPEFQITEHRQHAPTTLRSHSAQILFSLNSTARLESATKSINISPGSSMLIPSVSSEVNLKITSGTVYQITIPE